VTLCAEVASDVPTLDIDPARIRQVLENLIANALRHTPRGGRVCVRCSVSEASDGPRHVTLAVEDTGVGIAPEDLPHIFDRFAKAHDSRGMGLGLTIAKNLVAAHGGDISATSDLGKGTKVWIQLPADTTR
jgi:two-component system sensor histidine kinase BaeS